MIRTYLTLQDIISLLAVSGASRTNWYYRPDNLIEGFFSLFFYAYQTAYGPGGQYTVKKTDDVNDQAVFDVIYTRFYTAPIMYMDDLEGDLPTNRELILKTFLDEIAPHIYGWLIGEKQKYDLVLNELNSITDWMAPITTSTTNKFNDTPQENVDGSADPFTSNITNTINSTDGASPAVRYAEIREVADKVLSDVADGFRQFVIYA